MCFGGSNNPPPPAPVDPVVRATPHEDMSPTIEIAGEDGLGPDGKKLKKDAVGTKVLNTSINTGSIASAGLSIPN
tara:strand:- start:1370 stop:1594 length:225 start_codon:yes stop_codon:yes gene_type:complete